MVTKMSAKGYKGQSNVSVGTFFLSRALQAGMKLRSNQPESLISILLNKKSTTQNLGKLLFTQMEISHPS